MLEAFDEQDERFAIVMDACLKRLRELVAAVNADRAKFESAT
jgi:hypothetical protein